VEDRWLIGQLFGQFLLTFLSKKKAKWKSGKHIQMDAESLPDDFQSKTYSLKDFFSLAIF